MEGINCDALGAAKIAVLCGNGVAHSAPGAGCVDPSFSGFCIKCAPWFVARYQAFAASSIWRRPSS